MARKNVAAKPAPVPGPALESYTFERETAGFYVYVSTGPRAVKLYASKAAADAAHWTGPPPTIRVELHPET